MVSVPWVTTTPSTAVCQQVVDPVGQGDDHDGKGHVLGAHIGQLLAEDTGDCPHFGHGADHGIDGKPAGGVSRLGCRFGRTGNGAACGQNHHPGLKVPPSNRFLIKIIIYKNNQKLIGAFRMVLVIRFFC
jgi:hypothetical protein